MNSKRKSLQSALISIAMLASAAAAPLAGVQTAKVSAADTDNYAKLLQYSLYFYDANMCGTKAGSTSAFSWRENCHTNDEVDGGFHDAGDHAMFGLPQGYTASTLGWAYYEFKDSFDSLGQTAHYKTISNYFADFFKKSVKLNGDSVSQICIQKGLGDQDHGYWGPPEKQGDRGGCDWRSSGCGEIAAEYAAALALNYINFGNAEDLKYAKAIYNYAKNNMSCSSGDCQSFYGSDSVKDDIGWAAGWLYMATKEETYKNDCASNQYEYIGWVHSWNNVELGSACVYAHITGDWGKVNSYLGGQCGSNSYLCMSEWGSARYNAAMQMCALVATKNSNADFGGWCKGQMTYILGQNPANTCFVMGFASNSAKNAHHRAASGYNNYDELGSNKQYSSNGHILTGALVGGPADAGGTYSDVIDDYKSNEVALDYNAGLVGAAAGLYALYKTGTVDSNVNGIGAVQNTPTTEPEVTTTPQETTTQGQNTTTPQTTQNTQNTTTQTTQAPTPSGSGTYEIKPAKTIVYGELPKDDKMIGWDWADFGIPVSEKVKKVEINISASQDIGKWQGAFGTSTKKSPDYWAQSKDMEQKISGNSGTITWDVDSDISDIIQYGYGGQLKWGIWWIDCGTFTIDSIKVYTDGSGSGTTTTKATTVTTASTTKDTQNTTTQSTQAPNPSGEGTFEIKPAKTIVYGELPKDDKMIGWDWADFGIPVSAKVKKVEINISASQDIGKWQGAFGTSTKKSPDYWAQSDDMEQKISGKSGTITWDVPTDISDIIQYGYGGQLKWGIWWIDCGTFTVDSIKVYTDASSTTTTTKATTAATTTEKTTTTTKETTTATTTEKTTTSVTTTPSQGGDVTMLGDATGDNIVDLRDVALISQYLVKLKKLEGSSYANSDVNKDGTVNITDLTHLKRFLIKDIASL